MLRDENLMTLTEPREQRYFIAALVVSILVWLLCVITIFPIIYGLLIGLFIWLANGLLVAQLKSDGVRVNDTQFPALAGTFARVCSKLGVANVPEFYVVQSNGMLNAFATRHCGRNFVVVFSEVLEAYGPETPELEFLLGHEIGHIRRSHLQKRLFLFPGLMFPLLGHAYRRACELTCDRYGAFAASTPQGAVSAMMILAGGKHAKQDMSPEAFARQYKEDRGFFVSWYELTSGYPTLSQRVANLLAIQRGEPLQRASRNFFAYPFAFFTFGVPGGGGSNILIMVAIVALLAAIAVPSFMKARDQAQRTACRNNLSLIQDAKAQLATDGKHTADAELSMEEVALILNGRTLSCTAGGTYTANTAEQRPLCSVHGDGTHRISPNLKGHSTEESGD